MINFPAWTHHLSHQIPLYLRNIAVFDVMEYWYSKGIRQVFDGKSDRFSTSNILIDWYVSVLLIIYWYLIKWTGV